MSLVSTEIKSALLDQLKTHLLSSLPRCAVVHSLEIDPKARVDELLGAWQEIINVNHDLYRQSLENGTREGLLQVCDPPRVDDMASFDVVLCDADNSGFQPRSTRYGQGTLLFKLSQGSLTQVPTKDDGMVSISLGVAFRFQALEGVKPFRVALDDAQYKNKKGSKKATKDETKANQIKTEKIKAGLDCVVPLENTGMTANSQRIYWLPNAVLKLATARVQVEEHATCLCCFKEVPVRAGLKCTGGDETHFTCDECFVSHVMDSVNSDGNDSFFTSAFVMSEGAIRCPTHRCTSLPLTQVKANKIEFFVYDISTK